MSLVCPVLLICGGVEAGDLEGAFSHAPLGQSEGFVSSSLEQLCFSNVPSPSADVISFPESFQLDSKQSFIVLWKSFEMTNYFYIQFVDFSFLCLFMAESPYIFSFVCYLAKRELSEISLTLFLKNFILLHLLSLFILPFLLLISKFIC